VELRAQAAAILQAASEQAGPPPGHKVPL
jgi:hypothetical protein